MHCIIQESVCKHVCRYVMPFQLTPKKIKPRLFPSRFCVQASSNSKKTTKELNNKQSERKQMEKIQKSKSTKKVLSTKNLDKWAKSNPEKELFFPETPIIDGHMHMYQIAVNEGFITFAANNLRSCVPIFGAVGNTFGRTGAIFLLDYSRDAWESDKGSINVAAVVHCEGDAAHEKKGPKHLAPVGETKFIRSIYEQNKGSGLCKATIVRINLTLPENQIIEAMEAHQNALDGSDVHVCGVRIQIARHPKLLSQVKNDDYQQYVKGATLVGEKYGLPVDLWCYHNQLDQFKKLAQACPNTKFVCDHIGCPVDGLTEKTKQDWKTGMESLSATPNVVCKLGGLGMFFSGFSQDSPLNSDEIVDLFGPWYQKVFELFGADRVFFESNFPMDKATHSYEAFWQAAKKMAAKFSPDPVIRRKILFQNANEIYKLNLEVPSESLYSFTK